MTFLYLCSLHNNILLHCNPLIFNIWHVCVLLRIPVCNKQSERALWTRPEAHFLLMHSLNSKKKFAPLTRFELVYGAVYFKFLKIATHQQCSWTHFFFRPARPWVHKWAQLQSLFKQRGTGRENENCVELKLAKTLALRLAPNCAGCMIGP